MNIHFIYHQNVCFKRGGGEVEAEVTTADLAIKINAENSVHSIAMPFFTIIYVAKNCGEFARKRGC
jgi:hypothetical protein